MSEPEKKTKTPAPNPPAAESPSKAESKGSKLKDLGSGLASSVKKTIIAVVTAPIAFLRLLIEGEWSTRLLLAGFAASLVVLAMSANRIYHRFLDPHLRSSHKKEEESSSISKFFEAQKELQIAEANVVFLEKFTAGLAAGGHYEVEMYFECDEPETSRFIRARLEEAREWVVNALQGQNYEKLITDDGKEALRDQIIKAVNQGLSRKKPGASIKRVFFTNFRMG